MATGIGADWPDDRKLSAYVVIGTAERLKAIEREGVEGAKPDTSSWLLEWELSDDEREEIEAGLHALEEGEISPREEGDAIGQTG